MSSRAPLAIGLAFFLAGAAALGVAVTKRSEVAAPPAPAPAPPTPAPPPPSAPSAPSVAPSTPPVAPSAPSVPTAPSTPPPPTAAPAPVAPPPPPPPPPRPMRPELGLSLSDPSVLNGPIEIGPSSVGIVENAPKVAGLVGGSPASKNGIKAGDRIFSVDGHTVDSVAAFEAEMAKKTIPGEVV